MRCQYIGCCPKIRNAPSSGIEANPTTSPMIDSTNPAIAKPRSVCRMGSLLICDRATQERTIPGMLNSGPQQKSPRRPRAKPATAIPLVPVVAGAPDQGGGEAAMIGGTAGRNSENDSNGFHPAVPTACVRVCQSARPSMIQRRSCYASTGPHSRPSPPIILYISQCPICAISVLGTLPAPAALPTPSRASGRLPLVCEERRRRRTPRLARSPSRLLSCVSISHRAPIKLQVLENHWNMLISQLG
jgi:hypothetical protein